MTPRRDIYMVLGIVLLSFFVFATGALAQISIPGNGLDLSLSKQNPSPGDTVTITARSYSSDINASTVTWTVDGKIMQKGLGLTTLDLTAPALGKKLNVQVSSMASGGKALTSSVSIGSGAVDMILETNGYVHPFFAGKLNPAYQNKIKVIAFPHLANSSGTEYDPHDLVYKWKRNDEVLEEQSGYGKQSLTIQGDVVPRPYDVSVDVWTRDNTGHTQGNTIITAAAPSVSFYVDDPLYGPLFNRTIGSNIRIGSQKETDVRAVPWGFNGIGDQQAIQQNRAELGPVGALENSPVSFNWLINGTEHPELAAKQSIILRAPEGAAGSSNIQLTLRNTLEILQGASGGFSAIFRGDAGTSASPSPVTF